MNLENKKANRIYDELEFSRGLLGYGLNAIRKANIQYKYLYPIAFSSLGLGLERMGKICITLDYYIKNGVFPNEKKIKDYGHNLTKVFQSIENLYPNYCEKHSPLSEIHNKIIKELDEFAKGSGTRYSNINFITSEVDNNPIKNWYINIDEYILEKFITNSRKKYLEEQAKIISMFFSNTITTFHSELDEIITSHNELFNNIYLSQEVAGYRALFLIQIIEYIFDFLTTINHRLDREYYLDDLNRLFSVITYGSNYQKRRRKNFERQY
ncbi:hypothetical protein [Gallibacterium anatis]|uniref:hypothetical protein n=2 Tax=Pasteurellaceae TaxID=712 RepID=UPI0038B3D1FC